jgi:hypothetical protein
LIETKHETSPPWFVLPVCSVDWRDPRTAILRFAANGFNILTEAIGSLPRVLIFENTPNFCVGSKASFFGTSLQHRNLAHVNAKAIYLQTLFQTKYEKWYHSRVK